VKGWKKMLSKLAAVLATVALAVTAGFGAAAQADPVNPSAQQRVLANGTGPAFPAP
jgi:hypothetical protein